jgi:hypothetical protein
VVGGARHECAFVFCALQSPYQWRAAREVSAVLLDDSLVRVPLTLQHVVWYRGSCRGKRVGADREESSITTSCKRWVERVQVKVKSEGAVTAQVR